MPWIPSLACSRKKLSVPLGEMLAAVGMDLAPDQLEGRSSRSLAIILSLMGNRSDGTNAWQPNGDGIFTFGRADDFARAAKKRPQDFQGRTILSRCKTVERDPAIH